MKGIVLAGGNGTRLRPLTLVGSKQLAPVYDKPMVYYPLSVLMLTGIDDILIIARGAEVELFRRLFGDGSGLGMRIDYAVQDEPRGIADAFRVGADHIKGEDCALILGDNLFYGANLPAVLRRSAREMRGCVLFGHQVAEPQHFGVAEIDAKGRLVSIEEKPEHPRSNLAIPGLYFFDPDVTEIARDLKPSARGELEITDVLRAYLAEGRADLAWLGRGVTWLDTGTHESLLDAGRFVRTIQHHQGTRIGCIEEIAMYMGFITPDACYDLGAEMGSSPYGQYVMESAREYRLNPSLDNFLEA
ncbi:MULTISPECIES: glucose-1-phosphate thymidylyltransferase RfbA [Streptomyces]|uniref:glucose-1-phosphate thymidylyltransferase RfbA n=1 Tax=Streptomyces TaxID=1883 RepID=UPI001E644E1D|nr:MULTISPECIES: glucose-1-phosphate thymidylyltransferase RfbA [Streptomyces]UFQ18659.1 glucose-1-phosphate thymidylyltransferase RfbA [Streptomyces huasconensis]WCL88275.1 glucose-1-phosphate thymidylyltransferase RfbA [Streptomyces sp. JCM 35825]